MKLKDISPLKPADTSPNPTAFRVYDPFQFVAQPQNNAQTSAPPPASGSTESIKGLQYWRLSPDEYYKSEDRYSQKYMLSMTKGRKSTFHYKSGTAAAGGGMGMGDGGDDDHEVIKKLLEKLPATLKDAEGGAHDGHAYRKHVGKTQQDYEQRFAEESWIRRASSFKDEATAEMAYRELLKRHWREIHNWLKDPHSKTRGEFKVHLPPDSIGDGMRRGETEAQERWTAYFLFTKTPNGATIITAYPVEDNINV